MAYRVEIARNVEAELEELYLWVVERAPQQGAAAQSSMEATFVPARRPRTRPYWPVGVASARGALETTRLRSYETLQLLPNAGSALTVAPIPNHAKRSIDEVARSK